MIGISFTAIKSEQMFERMQLDPSLERLNNSTPPLLNTQNSTIKAKWKLHKKASILDMQFCPLNDTDRACDLYESCMGNFSSFIKAVALKKSVTSLDDDETSPYSFRKLPIVFGIGLGVGLLFGASFMFVITTMIEMCSKKKSSRLRRRNAMRNKNRGRGKKKLFIHVSMSNSKFYQFNRFP